MTEVERIELEIQKIGCTELAAPREWFRKYDAGEWGFPSHTSA